jgi:GNAT superfamily N-acetyltransferase
VLALAVHEGVGWIEQLYLAPAAVGQGLGSRLLALALAELPGPVRLWTFQANTGARRFYERQGFSAIEFGDGSGNEEGCPDVLYERRG